MMENLMELVMDAFRRENGQTAELENGDSFVAAFLDGTVVIEKDDDRVNISVIYGNILTVDATIPLD